MLRGSGASRSREAWPAVATPRAPPPISPLGAPVQRLKTGRNICKISKYTAAIKRYGWLRDTYIHNRFLKLAMSQLGTTTIGRSILADPRQVGSHPLLKLKRAYYTVNGRLWEHKRVCCRMFSCGGVMSMLEVHRLFCRSLKTQCFFQYKMIIRRKRKCSFWWQVRCHHISSFCYFSETRCT